MSRHSDVVAGAGSSPGRAGTGIRPRTDGSGSVAADRTDTAAQTPLPWNDKTAPDRVRPRECVRAARDALDRAYGIKERAAVPLLIEALDWLRRGLEQMAEVSGGDGKCP